jgi:uroporphyrinogen-III synthase
MPLKGRRVLVTRAIEDSRIWAERLSELGAHPVILPCIRTEPIDGAETRAHLRAALLQADWLCVTSPRGAEAVAGIMGPLPATLQVAAVGDATASAVRDSLHRAAFVARGGTSRALGEELLALLGPNAPETRIVVAAGEGGRADAESALQTGGASVVRVDVYRTIAAPPVPARRDLAHDRIGDVILASPSALTGLLNQASLPAAVRIFTVGPTTTAAVLAAGLRVSGQATHPDLESLVEVMQ